jgi:magnesium-transporting ATPase (P-type)
MAFPSAGTTACCGLVCLALHFDYLSCRKSLPSRNAEESGASIDEEETTADTQASNNRRIANNILDLGLYGIIVGLWWIRLQAYFTDRNTANGIYHGSNRLAAVALTGHLCDVTMGMALLPISRHSALASFFQISVSTTLTLHVLTAYTLFSLVVVHGLLYISWLPVYSNLSTALRRVIPVLNPTYLYVETWPGDTSPLGIWRASLIFTGSVASLIMLAILLTTFPKVRALHFNLFYFTHLLSILMVITICLHASTMFYCTAPGLAMWVLDWGMRLHELRRVLRGSISALGNGWFW